MFSLLLLMLCNHINTGFSDVPILNNFNLHHNDKHNIKYNNNACEIRPVHALILARGGSKGVKGKNLVRIAEQTLLARTISTIKSAELHFEQIWVSTDAEAIAAEALKSGALVHWRAAAYAQDNSTSLSAVQEFLSAHANIKRMALFQCTSVFMRVMHVEKAQRLFQCSDCVFAVTRSHKLRWKHQNNGELVPANFDALARPRRQDWSGELYETGMFYFSTRELIMQQNRFQNQKCSVVEIAAKDALEIDTIEDLQLARCLLTNVKAT